MSFNYLDNSYKAQLEKLRLINQELVIENHKLKEQIQQLTGESQDLQQIIKGLQLSTEKQTLKLNTTIEALISTNQALQAKIVELERKLNMNSSNSSLPPSSDKGFDKMKKQANKNAEEDDDNPDSEIPPEEPKKLVNLLTKLQEFTEDMSNPLKLSSKDMQILKDLLLSQDFEINGRYGLKRNVLNKLVQGQVEYCSIEEIISLLNLQEFVDVANYKKRGGQFGHKGAYLSQVKNPDKIKYLRPKICECGCKNLILNEEEYEARQEIDLIIKRMITEYRLVVGTCSSCGEKVKAGSDLPNNISYSDKIKCFVVYMLDAHFMTYERLAEYFKDIFELPISEGSINNWRKEFAANIGQGYLDRLKEVLLAANYLHADETTINIAGEKIWCHTICNEQATLLNANEKRGLEGITASDILNQYDGYLIVDGWASYTNLPLIKGIQTCFAHLFRYFKDINENYKQQWALSMLIFLSQFIDTTKMLYAAGITKYNIKDRAKFHKRYDKILVAGRKELGSADFEDNHKAWQLLRRLERDKALVLRFLDNTELPLTNNTAERSLRPLKVKQKISGCMLSTENAQENLKTRSFIATVKKQGQNVLGAMLKIFKDQTDFEIKPV